MLRGVTLRADCTRCAGLCCVAPTFSASADFAIDKPAGAPCPNLRPDFRCAIHARLRQEGFPGCGAYDCFGAGQQVTQHTFGGRNWREAPEIAARSFEVFGVMRQLHELLWYLAEALMREADGPLRAEVEAALDATERLTRSEPDFLATFDVTAHRGHIDVVLTRVSKRARADLAPTAVDRRGADLIGADLRGADLRAANLRGARLIGSDLRRADLRGADLLGTDLRGADLRGADLTGSLFLTRSQVGAAQGDPETGLPEPLERPAHWLAPDR